MAPWPNEVGSSAFLRPRDPATASNQARSPANARQHLQPGSTSGHGSSNRERSRYRSASRVPELEAWENLQQCQIESSSSDEDLHPSRNAQRPRHTRSMSHPFPSLFSIKKKKSGPMTRPEHESDSESGLDAGPLPKFRGRPPPSRGHRNGSSGGSRDYSTGNCMTCGSLVRWPRDLHVFKCTICLTINDLQPLPRDRDRGHDHNRENRRDHSRGAGASPDRRPTLSSGKETVYIFPLLLLTCCRRYYFSRTHTVVDFSVSVRFLGSCSEKPTARGSQSTSRAIHKSVLQQFN